MDVVDNGPGIPDERKTKLFQFGFNTTDGGLGLYICLMQMGILHGPMRVEDRVPDEYRKGVRFVVLLPAAKGDKKQRKIYEKISRMQIDIRPNADIVPHAPEILTESQYLKK